MIPCRQDGCTALVRASQGRGRPRQYCPAHATAVARKRRSRGVSARSLRPCCLDYAKAEPPGSRKRICPQHKNGGNVSGDKRIMDRLAPSIVRGYEGYDVSRSAGEGRTPEPTDPVTERNRELAHQRLLREQGSTRWHTEAGGLPAPVLGDDVRQTLPPQDLKTVWNAVLKADNLSVKRGQGKEILILGTVEVGT